MHQVASNRYGLPWKPTFTVRFGQEVIADALASKTLLGTYNSVKDSSLSKRLLSNLVTLSGMLMEASFSQFPAKPDPKTVGLLRSSMLVREEQELKRSHLEEGFLSNGFNASRDVKRGNALCISKALTGHNNSMFIEG